MTYRDTFVLIAAGIALCGAAVGQEGSATEAAKDEPLKEVNGLPLVFREDFGAGSDRWTATDANAWKIVEEEGNHAYALHKSSEYEPPVRSPHSISLIKDLEVTDFVLEARLKQTGKEYGHRDMCIFFGHVDPAHFYYVHIATKADDHANSVFLVNNEPRVSIAKERTTGTDWATGYHHIRVTRDTGSGRIEVFFDDMTKPIMVAEDKTFLSGKIGFGSFDDTGNVDDVRIWARKKESAAPPKEGS